MEGHRKLGGFGTSMKPFLRLVLMHTYRICIYGTNSERIFNFFFAFLYCEYIFNWYSLSYAKKRTAIFEIANLQLILCKITRLLKHPVNEALIEFS